LRKLEEDRSVEGLIAIHTEDCEVGNVSISETFRGHEGLREFWTEYRKTFDEMKYTFRNVFATEKRVGTGVDHRGHLQRRYRLLCWREHPRDRGR
jgi:SnoaL-like domain